MLGAHTDVTALKRAEIDLVQHTTDLERALAKTSAEEARFRLSFANAPIGMAVVSLAGRFLEVNRALCSFLQRSEHELKQIDFQSISHPVDCVADLVRFEQVLAGVRASYQVEKRYIRPDGSYVWALLAAALVRGTTGEPSHFVVHVKDIHSRRMANDATTARLRATFDDSFVGAALVIVEPERPGLVTQANEAFARLCNKDPQQIAGS
ncbi:MAG: PAS domain S-box protein, partial [Planctomycetes bacterium]|nr:PAS domain S-box protein [Planctomycetota bacterium]